MDIAVCDDNELFLKEITEQLKVIGLAENIHVFSNLSGFLTKPVDIKLLEANLQKIAGGLPYQEQPALVLSKRGQAISVPFREICYIESQNHTLHIHTADDLIMVYDKLENIMLSLPKCFSRCHKSYIVNMAHIRRIDPDGVLLKSGKQIPVSRAFISDNKLALATCFFRSPRSFLYWENLEAVCRVSLLYGFDSARRNV